MSNLLKYKDYRGQVEYSDEDSTFYGRILGINDLVSFEGSTVEELKKSFIESVDDYIETCKELGKNPEKEYIHWPNRTPIIDNQIDKITAITRYYERV